MNQENYQILQSRVQQIEQLKDMIIQSKSNNLAPDVIALADKIGLDNFIPYKTLSRLQIIEFLYKLELAGWWLIKDIKKKNQALDKT